MRTIKSAERALEVLTLLTNSASPLSAAAIARHCEMPRSSTYQLLKVMRKSQFLAYYEDQRVWGLGIAAFETGSARLRARSLEWMSRSILVGLAARTSEAAHLAVLDGDEVIYLAKEEPPAGAPFFVTSPGIRLPAHLTAIGRALLAHLPTEALTALFPPSFPLIRRTAHVIGDLRELELLLAADRERGYSVEQDSTTLGVTCIAAPVFGHSGAAVAAINIAFVSSKYLAPEHEVLAGAVIDGAAELSHKLGFDSSGPPRRYPGTGNPSSAEPVPGDTPSA